MPPSPRDRDNLGSEQSLLFRSLEMEQDMSFIITNLSHQPNTPCAIDHYSSLVTTKSNSSVTVVTKNSNNNTGRTFMTATPPHNQATSRTDNIDESSSQSFVDVPYRHLVLPSDTLAGLCLTYKISKPALQRANPGCCISGDGLRLTVQPGDRLYIPFVQRNKAKHGFSATTFPRDDDDGFAVLQDVNSHEYKVASVLGQITGLTTRRAERYVLSLFFTSVICPLIS